MKAVEFLAPLTVQEVGDGTVWRLVEPMRVRVGGQNVTVPAGFHTDFSSIPRVFRSVVPVLGRQNRASVLHDWLYVERWPDRKTADLWFLWAMKACDVPAVKRWAMYAAVRVGGGRAWRT
jgi:hypothetical protein